MRILRLRSGSWAATLLLPLLIAVAAGCTSNREPLEPRLEAIRTYGWPASVINPTPEWNPGTSLILARSLGGFSIFEEGGRGEQRFASDDRRECHNARWLNRDQFVFGPGWNARRAPDGTVTVPTDGITLVTMAEGKPVKKEQLSDRGATPRPAGGNRIVAQDGSRIIFIDSRAKIEEFGEGFDAVPQPDGPGLCWRDTPAFEPDWWTGRETAGVMHVRWRAGKVDDIAGGMEAAWTRHGGVLATVQLAPAPAGQPWWTGGTRIVHLAGPGLPAATIRDGAREPVPHPLADLLAWVGDDGGIWIGTLRPDGWTERVAVAGSRPRWSHDGLRLAWLEPPAAVSQVPAIRVAVLAVR